MKKFFICMLFLFALPLSLSAGGGGVPADNAEMIIMILSGLLLQSEILPLLKFLAPNSNVDLLLTILRGLVNLSGNVIDFMRKK